MPRCLMAALQQSMMQPAADGASQHAAEQVAALRLRRALSPWSRPLTARVREMRDVRLRLSVTTSVTTQLVPPGTSSWSMSKPAPAPAVTLQLVPLPTWLIGDSPLHAAWWRRR